jgi:flagellar motility protein MotE (MotC chaperone)
VKLDQRQGPSIRKRAPAPFPWIALAAVCISVSGGIGYFNPSLADRLPFSIGLSTAGASAEPTAQRDEKSGKAAESAATKDVKAAEGAASGPSVAMPAAADVRGLSDEEIRVFAQLNDRKRQLDQREAELNRLEEELQRKQKEIEEQLAKMERVRTDISSVLKDRVEQDQEKLDKLVQVYSAMKPVQAARVIEGLNEELAIEVLNKMKKKAAADILNIMDAKKAKRLSELLAGYQSLRSPAQTETRQ